MVKKHSNYMKRGAPQESIRPRKRYRLSVEKTFYMLDNQVCALMISTKCLE